MSYGTWQLALVLVPVYFIKHSVSCYIYYMVRRACACIFHKTLGLMLYGTSCACIHFIKHSVSCYIYYMVHIYTQVYCKYMYTAN